MQSAVRKLLYSLIGFALLAFLLYRASGFIRLADFSGARLLAAVRQARVSLLLLSLVAINVCYALRALRWMWFSRRLGPAHFGNIYRMTLAGFAAVFLLGRAGEPVRPLLLARKEKLPVADTFGIYVLERFFDTAAAVVMAAIGLLVFTAHHEADGTADALQTAARTTGLALGLGVVIATGMLVYLRVHGTAMLERRLQPWSAAHGWRGHLARIVLGFARGVQTIKTWGDLAAAVLFSTAHWVLVALIYLWGSHSFGGDLAQLSFSDAMILLGFTMVGSSVQLPVAGGGSQLASILAYTAIFGVEREPATAAAIVLWLITFAACSLAGVPLLVHEGMSLGELRRIAEREGQAVGETPGQTSAAPANRGGSAE